MTHTPGPWTADIYGDVYSPQNVVIACAFLNDADTHLIAAAPDLLDAVELALLHLDSTGKYPKEAGVFNELRRAINKAKGNI